LLYLKNKGIIHRDIKPENILIMNDLSIRLINFELSREINSCKKDHKKNWKSKSSFLERRLTKHVVTRWYRPPEVILL